jgi:hypothetical protein
VAADELETEAAVFAARHVSDAPVEDLAAVAADLPSADRGQLRRRQPLVAQEAVHVRRGRVSGVACIDDDHQPALTPELQGGCEPGRRSTDDGDVAEPFDDVGGLIAHAPNVSSNDCNCT